MKKRYGCLLLFVLMLTFLIGCTALAVDKDDVSDAGNKPAVSDLGNTSDTETTTVATTESSTSHSEAETSTTNISSSTSGTRTEVPIVTSSSVTAAPTSDTTTTAFSATVTENNPSRPSSTTSAKYISRDEAKRIALTAAGVTDQETSHWEMELDYDDDYRRWEYEISFCVGRVEYECEINAEDGTVIELTHEVD